MSLTSLSVTGYRSIRWIRFPVRRLSVLVGGNGVGKTNLYRSLQLLQSAADGTLATEIAREGGLSSLYFAGERKRNEQPRLVLEATLEDVADHPLQYSLTVGFPTPVSAALPLEAQVKEEKLLLLAGRKPVELMDRQPAAVWARDAGGHRILASDELLASETALSTLRGGYREIDATRHAIAGWRFYHAFRTDPDSPLRKPSLAITSPTPFFRRQQSGGGLCDAPHDSRRQRRSR
jgi:predicted ATPase